MITHHVTITLLVMFIRSFCLQQEANATKVDYQNTQKNNKNY